MKKVSIKKKLSFKKGLVANLNEGEAHAIQGGQNNTSLGWPCGCPQPSQQSNIPCACPGPTPTTDIYGDCNCGGDSWRYCESIIG